MTPYLPVQWRHARTLAAVAAGCMLAYALSCSTVVETGDGWAEPPEPDATSSTDDGPGHLDVSSDKLAVKLSVPSAVLSGVVSVGAEVTGKADAIGVEFHVDGVRVDTDLVPPYTSTFDTGKYTDGEHTVSCSTTDVAGGSASDACTVTFDNTPPQIALTWPGDGDTVYFEDGPLHLEAGWAPEAASIVAVTFRVNGLTVAKFVSPPYVVDVPWDSLFVDEAALPKNLYIQFEAEDQLGMEDKRSFNVTVAKRFAWKFETQGEIWATATLAPNGNLLFGNNTGKYYSLTPDGALAFEVSLDAGVTVQSAVSPATGASYVGTLSGTIQAVSAAGSPEWSINIGSPPGGALRFQSDVLYVVAFSGTVQALNPSNGSTIWTANLPDHSSSSPTVSPDGIVYVGCQDAHLYAVQGGQILWSVPAGGEVWSTPTIAADGTLYFGANDGWLYAVAPGGAKKWSVEIKGQIWGQALAATDGAIYVGSTSKYLTRLNAADGATVWSTKIEGLTYSSPVQGPDGLLHLGTAGGKMVGADPLTGAVRWTYQTGATAIHATPVLVGHRLFFGSTDRNFYALWIASQ